jgi:hypothetical protein
MTSSCDAIQVNERHPHMTLATDASGSRVQSETGRHEMNYD